jgi:CheY-like chemotaxis protein
VSLSPDEKRLPFLKNGRAMSGPRILCVEDDPRFRSVLATGFEVLGFEVVMAGHGREALIQFRKYAGAFDVILTDNEMPEMDGLELVHEVRMLNFKGRIVVMSGHLSPERLSAFSEHNVNGFFQKPFDIGMLAALLS